jgi:hypothetical protein
VTAQLAGVLLFPVLSGCGRLTETRVATPSVDPSAAAAEAIRLYDKDGDNRLNDAELAACPAIRSARNRYDTDSDQQVSLEEITQHLEKMYASGAGLLEVQCTVTRGGRPLPNATVRFVPEPFLGEAIHPAVATTDSSGMGAPAIDAEHLPEKLRSLSMMQAGLYRVEIEHASLPSGSNKSFGFEVDPTSREGATARFNL